MKIIKTKIKTKIKIKMKIKINNRQCNVLKKPRSVVVVFVNN